MGFSPRKRDIYHTYFVRSLEMSTILFLLLEKYEATLKKSLLAFSKTDMYAIRQ